MPQRKVFVEPQPIDCAAGLVGENQVYDVCDYKLRDIKRIVLKKKSGANPFTTIVLLQTELTWDTLLALTTADTPDNVLLSTKVYNSTETGGEANILTSDSGDMRVTHYTEDQIMVQFAFLDPTMSNDLMATIRDNPNSLECYIVNTDGRIRHGLDETGLIPEWIPIKLATFKSRDASGRSNPETNDVMLYFDEEVLTNALQLTTLDFDIFTK